MRWTAIPNIVRVNPMVLRPSARFSDQQTLPAFDELPPFRDVAGSGVKRISWEPSVFCRLTSMHATRDCSVLLDDPNRLLPLPILYLSHPGSQWDELGHFWILEHCAYYNRCEDVNVGRAL